MLPSSIRLDGSGTTDVCEIVTVELEPAVKVPTVLKAGALK